MNFNHSLVLPTPLISFHFNGVFEAFCDRLRSQLTLVALIGSDWLYVWGSFGIDMRGLLSQRGSVTGESGEVPTWAWTSSWHSLFN
jgi:hypothetical protein